MKKVMFILLIFVVIIIILFAGFSIFAKIPKKVHDTTKSGFIGTETWSGTINVTGDLVVHPWATLTIKPGTVIFISPVDNSPKFSTEVLPDGFNDLDPTRLEEYDETHITISGKIIALGTKDKTIIFTSAAENPKIADWSQLNLDEGSRLDYVIVEYLRTPSANGDDIEITNSIFRHLMWGGISLADKNSRIINNTIYDCGHEGLDVHGGAPYIANNLIYECNTGIVVITDNLEVVPGHFFEGRSNPTIVNNTLFNNGHGIYILNSDGTYLNNNVTSPLGPAHDWCYEDFCYENRNYGNAFSIEGNSSPVFINNLFVNRTVESPEEISLIEISNQNISGEIKQSQIWSENIYVTGDTWTVPEATITILPGTNVYIAAARDDQNSGMAGDVAEFWDPIETEEYAKTHIDIHARIVAKGLPNQKILFTSDAPEKTFADWGCIGLIEGSIIDNAIVEYGGNCGLDSTVCGECKNVTISNSVIRHVLWGCVTLGGSSATVINNEIYDCGHEGIDTQSGGGKPVIKNNVIKYSANGLMLNENSFPLVENNTIVDNSIGINAWGCGGKIIGNYISSPNGPPNDWIYKNYVYRRDSPRSHTNSCPNPDPNLGCPETEPRTGIITIPATTAEFVNNTIENVEEEIRMEG